MSITYNNLWHMLIDRGMTKTELRQAAGISSGTLAKLSKCEDVNTVTLGRICKVLKCDVGDIMSFVPDEDGVEKNRSIKG